MVSMTNQAGNLTPSEMERIKWTENEIQLNNLTSADGSQFMIDVNCLLSFHNIISLCEFLIIITAT